MTTKTIFNIKASAICIFVFLYIFLKRNFSAMSLITSFIFMIIISLLNFLLFCKRLDNGIKKEFTLWYLKKLKRFHNRKIEQNKVKESIKKTPTIKKIIKNAYKYYFGNITTNLVNYTLSVIFAKLFLFSFLTKNPKSIIYSVIAFIICFLLVYFFYTIKLFFMYIETDEKDIELLTIKYILGYNKKLVMMLVEEDIECFIYNSNTIDVTLDINFEENRSNLFKGKKDQLNDKNQNISSPNLSQIYDSNIKSHINKIKDSKVILELEQIIEIFNIIYENSINIDSKSTLEEADLFYMQKLLNFLPKYAYISCLKIKTTNTANLLKSYREGVNNINKVYHQLLQNLIERMEVTEESDLSAMKLNMKLKGLL